MKRKLRVAILFGGKSAEHEISVISARNIAAAMDKKKYHITAIAIDKSGRWFFDENRQFLSSSGPATIEPQRQPARVAAVLPGATEKSIARFSGKHPLSGIDVVFPILHGPFGEDGTVQGLLKLANVPFVGAGVLGSAVGMDKDVMKRLLREAGIPIPKFLTFHDYSSEKIHFASITRRLGLPVFVKPANLGSSVGISKVESASGFVPAIREAFRYDSKILIEESVQGREIECSILGNESPIASVPGEIVTRHAFYSYEAKYLDEKGAELIIPARLPAAVRKKIQEIAVQTFQVLCCEGMARVDFFLRGRGEVLVNEINTIPGFTQISMYPKLWEASGIPYSKLIDRLIQLALERSRKENALRMSF